MRILIVSGNPHVPQFSGGVESTTHDLALELKKRGHQVAVLCRLIKSVEQSSKFIMYLRKHSPHHFPADRFLGYPVYRQRYVLLSIPAAVRQFTPDVAIVQIGDAVRLAHALSACSVPVLFYLHNVDFGEMGGNPRTLSGVHFIANSEFTSRRYKEEYDIDSIVIPPLFHAERYISRHKPSNVTFINPHVFKGRDIALKVAEHCPEIPFSFIESWTMKEKEVEDLSARIALLPNVTFRRRTDDMKTVYNQAKILLVPSVCEEAWGRVVTEAQFTGIPVVASKIGGLPETVGPGGVLLDPRGPIEPWVDTVKRLWVDEDFYRVTSAAALAHSRRSEINTTCQIDALLAAAQKVMSKTSVLAKPMERHGDSQSSLTMGMKN